MIDNRYRNKVLKIYYITDLLEQNGESKTYAIVILYSFLSTELGIVFISFLYQRYCFTVAVLPLAFCNPRHKHAGKPVGLWTFLCLGTYIIWWYLVWRWLCWFNSEQNFSSCVGDIFVFFAGFVSVQVTVVPNAGNFTTGLESEWPKSFKEYKKAVSETISPRNPLGKQRNGDISSNLCPLLVLASAKVWPWSYFC